MQMQTEGHTYVKSQGFFKLPLSFKALLFLIRICACLINTVLIMGSICGMDLDHNLNKFFTEWCAEIAVLKEYNQITIIVLPLFT